MKRPRWMQRRGGETSSDTKSETLKKVRRETDQRLKQWDARKEQRDTQKEQRGAQKEQWDEAETKNKSAAKRF